MTDPDAILDKAAKALLATRAPGLGKRQWARRAVAAVIEVLEVANPAPPAVAVAESPIIHIRPRQCGGWIGTHQEGTLRFGVTADTEATTRAELDVALARWRLLALPMVREPSRGIDLDA